MTTAQAKAEISQLRMELEQNQIDLAEVIDEVVFAENDKKRAQEDLERYRLQTIREEESLVRCIEHLTSYMNMLEADVVVPAIGSFVVSLANHHDITKKRSSVVQSVENLAAAHPAMSSSADRILENLQPPSANNATAARRLQSSSPSRTSRFSADDSFVMASNLAECSARAQALSNESLRLVEQYYAHATNRSKKISEEEAVANRNSAESVAFMREEIEFLRDTVTKQQERLQNNKRMDDTEEVAHLRHELENERNHSAKRFQASSDRMESLLKTIRELETQMEERRLHSDSNGSGGSFGSPQKSQGDEVKILQGRIRELERANAQNISENHRLEDRLNEAEGLLVEFRQNNKKLQQEDRGDSASNDAKYVIRLLQSEVRDLKEQISDQQRDGDMENERLRRKIEVLSSKRADASLLDHSELVNRSVDVTNQQREYLGKIKAFEMTVTALNNEICALEERQQHVEQRHTDELHELRAELSSERRDHKNEREEYDMVVTRITTEIEDLMKENIHLKQRLRHAYE